MLRIALLLWCLPAPALATVTVQDGQFRRDNELNSERDPSLGDPNRRDEADGINFEECSRTENWHYEVLTSGESGNSLYVYVGDACDQADRRDGTGDDCRRIGDIRTLSGDSTTHEIDLSAAEIAGATSSCSALSDSVKVYFLSLRTQGEDTPASFDSSPQQGDIVIDTTPPTGAPSDVSVSAGDTRATVSWQATSDTDRYYVVCFPVPGTSAAPADGARSDGGVELCEPVDAGVQGTDAAGPGEDAGEPSGDAGLDAAQDAGTGGDDGGGADAAEGAAEDAGAESETSGFERGAPFDRRFRCDSSDPFGISLVASPTEIGSLTNGVQYHFAVVAADEIGNAGVMSEVVCATPRPVDDFFELYRAAGGSGGGGICSIAPGGAAAAAGMLALAAAVGFLARRRR